MRVSVSLKPVRSPKRLTVHNGLDSMKAYHSKETQRTVGPRAWARKGGTHGPFQPLS